jgi:DNA polymerase-4
MSRETTFERDLHAVRDKAELGAIFTTLCQQVAADLERKGYVGKTIGIKLRFDDFKSVTRDQTLTQYTASASTIRQVAGQCLKRVPLDKRLRLLGVRVGSLIHADLAPAANADATAVLATPKNKQKQPAAHMDTAQEAITNIAIQAVLPFEGSDAP